MKTRKKKIFTKKHSFITAPLIIICLFMISTMFFLRSSAIDYDTTMKVSQTVDNATPYAGQNFTYTLLYSDPNMMKSIDGVVLKDILVIDIHYITSNIIDYKDINLWRDFYLSGGEIVVIKHM